MTLSQGIVKINSKALEPSDLKKYDRIEKDLVTANSSTFKGKPEQSILYRKRHASLNFEFVVQQRSWK